jgi:hypothetical protein
MEDETRVIGYFAKFNPQATLRNKWRLNVGALYNRFAVCKKLVILPGELPSGGRCEFTDKRTYYLHI